MKPFGTGTARFNYQQPRNNAKSNTIDFNQMISVKDKVIQNKREAFLQTI